MSGTLLSNVNNIQSMMIPEDLNNITTQWCSMGWYFTATTQALNISTNLLSTSTKQWCSLGWYFTAATQALNISTNLLSSSVCSFLLSSSSFFWSLAMDLSRFSVSVFSFSSSGISRISEYSSWLVIPGKP